MDKFINIMNEISYWIKTTFIIFIFRFIFMNNNFLTW